MGTMDLIFKVPGVAGGQNKAKTVKQNSPCIDVAIVSEPAFNKQTPKRAGQQYRRAPEPALIILSEV